jgi:PAS domain S-box-containing protein
MNGTAEPIPRIAQRAGALIAALVAGIALLVLLGWALGLPLLVRISPAYPPMYPLPALGLLAAAAGLYGIASGRPRLVSLGAALVLLLGGFTLLEYVTGVDAGLERLLLSENPFMAWPTPLPGRMPALSALSLVLVGTALLGLHLPRWKSEGYVLTGTLGAILSALAIALLLSYATGVLSSVRGGVVAGLSLQACFAFGLLGAGLMAVAWRRDAPLARLPDWVPYGAGVAMLITTVVVWRALETTERDHSIARVHTVAQVAHRKLVADLDGVAGLLRRRSVWTANFAQRLGLDAGTWQASIEPVLAALPGLRAAFWLDSAGAIRSAARADAGSGVTMRAAEAELRTTSDRARNPGAMLTRLTSDDGGSPLLSIMVPNCGNQGCAGFTAGFLDPNTFLKGSLEEVTPGYSIRVGAEGRVVYSSADSTGGHAGVVGSSFNAAGLPWTLEVWPSAKTAAAFHSGLPMIVAGLGVAVSVLLALTLWLLQQTHRTAQTTERAKLAHALESTTDGLWERNEKTGKSSRSAAVWRRLGYDPGEIEAPGSTVSWESLLHPEDRAEYDARLQKHLSGASDAFELEYRVEARTGDWHWIVDRGRIIERDERGRPVRTLGLCADVTERKRTEHALTASEHRFRTMFDRGFQLEHLLDVNCNLLEANQTSLEMVGVTIDAVRGKPFWETPWWAGEPDREKRLKCACEDALLGKTIRYQEEVRGPGDRVTKLDFSITPIIDSEGRVIQLLAEGRDITERQRGEDAMRELDTLSTMGRLAARVAHEINNPLAGIQNSFLLIKGAIPESHPYYAYVGAIEREIARMAAITRQLYETYRPDGDRREEASVPILISDAVTMLEQVNRATKVHIEVDTSGSPAVLQLPGALLRQAVYNLVQNAVEASPHGGTVRVRAWRADNTFWLSVTDQGPGVPADIRARIFEPFVTTKSGIRTGGMGLGLSLVKRSVQALGGRIELRDPEGGGAEFRIAIPLP